MIFPNILDLFALAKRRTILELLEIIYETITLTKVLLENVAIVIFTKECILLNFAFYNLC